MREFPACPVCRVVSDRQSAATEIATNNPTEVQSDLAPFHVVGLPQLQGAFAYGSAPRVLLAPPPNGIYWCGRERAAISTAAGVLFLHHICDAQRIE